MNSKKLAQEHLKVNKLLEKVEDKIWEKIYLFYEKWLKKCGFEGEFEIVQFNAYEDFDERVHDWICLRNNDYFLYSLIVTFQHSSRQENKKSIEFFERFMRKYIGDERGFCLEEIDDEEYNSYLEKKLDEFKNLVEKEEEEKRKADELKKRLKEAEEQIKKELGIND